MKLTFLSLSRMHIRVLRRVIVILILSLILFFSSLSYAQPVINNYNSDITIQPNSSILVTEQINITTDGENIRHGIYRDIPTRYQNKNIFFKVISASLNDAPIAYHTENRGNGVRIYIGSSSVTLPAATYNFTLTYSVQGALGFFPDHDELYWNVTGNGWHYPIEQAEATVHLPDDAWQSITGYQAYTGYEGSKDQNYSVNTTADHAVFFKTTSPLSPSQGLTIAVGWKKGFVTQQTYSQNLLASVLGEPTIIILALGFLVTLIYCIAVWNHLRYRNQIIIPEYEPPTGFDPAALRYILEMGYDDKVLTALILNLAVKGYLQIKETDSLWKKNYTLTKVDNFNGELSSDEALVANQLFANGNSIELRNQTRLEEVARDYQFALKKNYNKYFAYQNKFVYIGILLALVIVSLTVFLHPTLIMCLVGVAALFLVVKANQYVPKFTHLVFVIFFFIFIIISFLANQIFSVLGDNAPWYLLFLSLIFITILFFAHFIQQPTAEGEVLVNHIKGFRLFLNATEKDRLNFRNPPDRTPELFEKYLPYALALGVEQTWSEQFSAQLAAAQYRPCWYIGSSPFMASTFVTTMSSNLTSAISSAKTVGESSGLGGGGSSGGGGGGGGGGGW